jgi:hypothetical protein
LGQKIRTAFHEGSLCEAPFYFLAAPCLARQGLKWNAGDRDCFVRFREFFVAGMERKTRPHGRSGRLMREEKQEWGGAQKKQVKCGS